MFISLNPSTGEKVWEGNEATTQEVTYAIKAARKALNNWYQLGFEKRVEYVLKFQELLIDQKEAFAKTISTETGKPMWETVQELG